MGSCVKLESGRRRSLRPRKLRGHVRVVRVNSFAHLNGVPLKPPWTNLKDPHGMLSVLGVIAITALCWAAFALR
jgi:hypothetical protein